MTILVQKGRAGEKRCCVGDTWNAMCRNGYGSKYLTPNSTVLYIPRVLSEWANSLIFIWSVAILTRPKWMADHFAAALAVCPHLRIFFAMASEPRAFWRGEMQQEGWNHNMKSTNGLKRLKPSKWWTDMNSEYEKLCKAMKNFAKLWKAWFPVVFSLNLNPIRIQSLVSHGQVAAGFARRSWSHGICWRLSGACGKTWNFSNYVFISMYIYITYKYNLAYTYIA